jgi:hypothetical protein
MEVNMSLESINSFHNTWGAAATASKAAIFGRREEEEGGGFEDTLKNNAGFGAKNDDGAVTNSIAGLGNGGPGGGGLDDLLDQLQFSFLKNNSSANGLNQRLSSDLF